MGFLSQKWNHDKAWSEWRNKYKMTIRCPKCNARHYPTRTDNRYLENDGQYMVKCSGRGCNHKYWVVDGKTHLYIKEYRNGQ